MYEQWLFKSMILCRIMQKINYFKDIYKCAYGGVTKIPEMY